MTGFYDLRAELYDLAFDWDVEDEVDWLIERLGTGCRSILEPGCGSGRMFPPFARRGITVTGLDVSETMLERARMRMADQGLPAPPLQLGDMADFDLMTTFDGAILPINTFGYLLSEDRAKSHLLAVARHLKPGAKYLVQADLRRLDRADKSPERDACSWEMEKDGIRLQTTWGSESYDPASRIETQVSRFEVLSGPDKGRSLQDRHECRRWDWAAWKALLAETPFEQAGAYDGGSKDRPPVEPGPALDSVRLTWHELLKKTPAPRCPPAPR